MHDKKQSGALIDRRKTLMIALMVERAMTIMRKSDTLKHYTRPTTVPLHWISAIIPTQKKCFYASYKREP